jgi:hypothetical protein
MGLYIYLNLNVNTVKNSVTELVDIIGPGRRPSGARDQFYFLLEIFFRQLRFCNFVAPSLTRGLVCNLLVQLLLGLTRAVTLGSKSRRTHGHILLSHLKLPQPGGPGSQIYILGEHKFSLLIHYTGCSFLKFLPAKLMTQGAHELLRSYFGTIWIRPAISPFFMKIF